MPDPYSILGINPDASIAQIKNAYRALAKKYHPDVSKEKDAEEKFIKISEAYQILTENPFKFQFKQAFCEPDINEDHEFQRRERARQYAEMKFETFKRNNDAFRKSWYFRPVKYGVYLLILFSYLLAISMFLAPVIAWFITENIAAAVLMVPAVLFSSHTYKYANLMQKEAKPYFANY